MNDGYDGYDGYDAETFTVTETTECHWCDEICEIGDEMTDVGGGSWICGECRDHEEGLDL